MTEKSERYVLGIDLGTSTTTVSIVKDGMAQIVPIKGEEYDKIMPSVVSFLNEGKNVIVGRKAKERRHLNPINTIYSIKSCLLYTSPSPRDRTRTRMPSSA